MSEETLLDEGTIQVTTARLISSKQTYALANITSVRMDAGGSLGWAIGTLVFATIILIASKADPAGIVAFVVLAAWGGGLLLRALKRRIVINTSGKDQVAYTTGDRQHAERVLKALNEAISRR